MPAFHSAIIASLSILILLICVLPQSSSAAIARHDRPPFSHFNTVTRSCKPRTFLFADSAVERRGGAAAAAASRTLDPRVVRSDPGRSVTRACVPGQNTFIPLIARVFSDRTLKIVGPFYPVSMPGEVKDRTLVVQNVTCSGLNPSSMSWWHWPWASCAHHRLHDTNI